MFKAKSIKDVALHLLLIIITITLLILGFFYIYLPKTTNHGETLTVPDLEGMPFANVDEVLTERNMRYEVQADSSYSADYPPFTILKQYPAAGSKVKENRKISLSLNAANPPLVKMPRLEDGSVKNAQMVLESFGLVLGEIEYKPDLAQNAVLEQMHQGREIEEGTLIHKGSVIDLIVGDGLGNRILPVPDVAGMSLEDAEFLIIGSGLKLGSVIHEFEEGHLPGTIIRQLPPAGESVRIGDVIDLWVVEVNENDGGLQDSPIIRDLETDNGN
jgi:beta-lactam-binding protein with PASTA domain